MSSLRNNRRRRLINGNLCVAKGENALNAPNKKLYYITDQQGRIVSPVTKGFKTQKEAIAYCLTKTGEKPTILKTNVAARLDRFNKSWNKDNAGYPEGYSQQTA